MQTFYNILYCDVNHSAVYGNSSWS